MADKPEPKQSPGRAPVGPPTPPSARPAEGGAAPPVSGAPEAPQLRSAKVVRSGAIVMAVLWEE